MTKSTVSNKLVMHGDLNPNNTLFGGIALQWIDEVAAIHAMKILQFPPNIVTKLMSTVNFMAPAKLGDVIEITAETVKIGTSSLVVSVDFHNARTNKHILRVDEMVFVNVDSEGKSLPHGIVA